MSAHRSARKVAARPYSYPALADLSPRTTPLILTGCQAAALEETGADGAAALRAARRLTKAWADAGGPVILTRRGVLKGAAAPGASGWRSARRRIDRILMAGEPGWTLVIEHEAAIIVDHPGDNAFLGSDLDHVLRLIGADAAVFGGLVTEGTVHATMRAANDRGLDCLLVTDASASTDPAFHATIVSLTTFGNGLFGAVAETTDVLSALG